MDGDLFLCWLVRVQIGTLFAVSLFITTIIWIWIWHPLYTTTDEMLERVKAAAEQVKESLEKEKNLVLEIGDALKTSTNKAAKEDLILLSIRELSA